MKRVFRVCVSLEEIELRECIQIKFAYFVGQHDETISLSIR